MRLCDDSAVYKVYMIVYVNHVHVHVYCISPANILCVCVCDIRSRTCTYTYGYAALSLPQLLTVHVKSEWTYPRSHYHANPVSDYT